MAAQNGDDLAGDLAGGEIALDAELGGETELAVDGAADLRGDADGGAAACGRRVVGYRSSSAPSPSGIQTVSTV